MAFLLNGALVLRGRYDLFIHRFLIPKYPECNNLRLIYFFFPFQRRKFSYFKS